MNRTASDQSIRAGDVCRAGEVTGTIVGIGIRSTRIRTLNRTLVSIPNGLTAAVSIENYSARDKFHFLHVIGVRCETDAAAMQAVLASVCKLLGGFSGVEPETLRVRFIRFGASPLGIEIRAYVYAAAFDDFLARQETLLPSVMDQLATCGAGISFPSQTLYLSKDR